MKEAVLFPAFSLVYISSSYSQDLTSALYSPTLPVLAAGTGWAHADGRGDRDSISECEHIEYLGTYFQRYPPSFWHILGSVYFEYFARLGASFNAEGLAISPANQVGTAPKFSGLFLWAPANMVAPLNTSTITVLRFLTVRFSVLSNRIIRVYNSFFSGVHILVAFPEAACIAEGTLCFS